MITYSVDSRGAVVGDNAETVERYVHRDTICKARDWIRNDANASGNAQLTTGITVWEQDVTDLLNRISAVVRANTLQAQAARSAS